VNERIKQLAIQVIGDYSYGDYWPFFEEELDKFAEVIIRECCSIVNDRTQHNNPNDCLTVLDIKEHFGVED